MILQHAIKINATPSAVFHFFEEMERNYLRWHPDHVHFEWLSGRGVKEGVMIYFEERIAGKLLKKKVVFTKVTPDEHLEFAPAFWLFRLFLPRMWFRMWPREGECLFEAGIQVRMGPLAAWWRRRELEAVRAHMRQEGENLKRLLEQPPASVRAANADESMP